jgi:Ca2+-binding RTX toxin-like protein
MASRSIGTLFDVRTVTLTIAGAQTLGETIQLTGSTVGDGEDAFVIDATGLPSGSVIELDHIEFAGIVGSVTVTGGAGQNYAAGDGSDQNISLGADTVNGGQDTDVVYGNQGNDTLSGGSGLDTLFGGMDDDILYGNTGADILGADAFALAAGDGADQVLDFSTLQGDRLQVDISGTSITSLGELVRNLSTDASGNLLVGLGASDASLTLIGLTAADTASIGVDLLSGGILISTGMVDGTATAAASVTGPPGTASVVWHTDSSPLLAAPTDWELWS